MNGLFYSENPSSRAHKVYLDSIYDQKEYENNNLLLGDNATRILYLDPKMMGFIFARHKFVAKMMDGYSKVLEIGCQEGLGSVIVAKNVQHLVAIDFYKPYIQSCQERLNNFTNIEFRGFDIVEKPIKENFDGIFALDVIEHISPDSEDQFMLNIIKSLSGINGVCIIGTPSLESQQYASESSKIGHINCKTGIQLQNFCKRFFHKVFMFAMNDEVLHVGYLKMGHYLMALCINPKQELVT